MSELTFALKKIAHHETLSAEEAKEAFHILMNGGATDIEIAAFLMGLKARGECVDELYGAAATMRAHMETVKAPDKAIDIVGTGGDGHNTYNISTAAAILAAAAGQPIAKHGNRSISSKSGAADILSALGVKADLTAKGVEACLNTCNIGFMLAQVYHPAMKHVMHVRRALGVATIYNLLGPLSNPAGVKRAVIGLFSPEWLEPIAMTLKALGMERAWIVHGNGLDELTTTGDNKVISLKHGRIKRFTISPESLGLKRAHLDDLRGGSPEDNAKTLHGLLNGEPSAYADVAKLNAAAGLKVGGLCDRLEAGMDMVDQAIQSGAAKNTLARLVDTSNGFTS